MKKLMNLLMLSCKKATELIDKKIHTGITRRENVQLHMHTLMCNACRNYEKQGHLIDTAIKESLAVPGPDYHAAPETPPDLVEKVIHSLEKSNPG
jgi:hypothetical protein